MQLERVVIVFEFEREGHILTFLESEDVRRQKFGTSEAVPLGQFGFRQLIQTDGFRLTAVSPKRIQVDYGLPNEVRDLSDDALSHVSTRLKRLTSALSKIDPGIAKWIGVQGFLAEEDETSKSGQAALRKWFQHIGSPLYRNVSQLAAFNLTIGVYTEGYYEGVTIQPYETRMISLPFGNEVALPQGLNMEELGTVASAGIQYVVDVNTKKREAHSHIDREVEEVISRLAGRYEAIIKRGMNAVMGNPIDA